MGPTPPSGSGLSERDSRWSRPLRRSRRSPVWGRQPQRGFLMAFALAVVLYSCAIIFLVAWMGDIGARCVLSNELKEPVPASFEWRPSRPGVGDRLVSIGSTAIDDYTDYVKALR